MTAKNIPEPDWPPARVAIWIIIAAATLFWQVPNWILCLQPARQADSRQFYDFSQEWLSGRNYWTGRPVYSPQEEALLVHTGFQPKTAGSMLPWNAHPPVSILLGLPFALFDYEYAHFAWNWFMLACLFAALVLALRNRGASFHFFDLLWLVPLIAVCSPLYVQVVQGQLNGVLVLLVVLAWEADRRQREVFAGVLVGAAAAIKVIPAFLFIYWLARGRWRALVGGVASFLFLNGIALLLFGSESYRTYIAVVIPSVSEYRSSWDNISISGFFFKLFDPHERERVVALSRQPTIARCLSGVGQIAVTLLVAYRCYQCRDRDQRDHAFGLSVIGMFLVSPVTWGHYLLMMLIPLTVPTASPKGPLALALYRTCYAVLWLPIAWYGALVMEAAVVGKWSTGRYQSAPAQPWQVLTGLSVQTYALVTLFILYWRSFPIASSVTVETASEQQRETVPTPPIAEIYHV